MIPSGLLINEIFSCMDFIVTLIHCVTYKYVSNFSKSKHIWSFRVNCNTCLTDVHVKPLPVQKSICLLMRPFNHPENKGKYKFTSVPITYNCTDYFHKINQSEYNDQSLCFSFSLFHSANGDLSITSLRMTSHCMTSRCGVLSLLGLCEKDFSIHMRNFNKLRIIVTYH